MENTSYYLEDERLVFLTVEDARKYYFEEESSHFASDYIDLNEFLNNKGYTCEDIFYLNEDEKADIIFDYHEELFQSWVREELTQCYMYK